MQVFIVWLIFAAPAYALSGTGNGNFNQPALPLSPLPPLPPPPPLQPFKNAYTNGRPLASLQHSGYTGNFNYGTQKFAPNYTPTGNYLPHFPTGYNPSHYGIVPPNIRLVHETSPPSQNVGGLPIRTIRIIHSGGFAQGGDVNSGSQTVKIIHQGGFQNPSNNAANEVRTVPVLQQGTAAINGYSSGYENGGVKTLQVLTKNAVSNNLGYGSTGLKNVRIIHQGSGGAYPNGGARTVHIFQQDNTASRGYSSNPNDGHIQTLHVVHNNVPTANDYNTATKTVQVVSEDASSLGSNSVQQSGTGAVTLNVIQDDLHSNTFHSLGQNSAVNSVLHETVTGGHSQAELEALRLLQGHQPSQGHQEFKTIVHKGDAGNHNNFEDQTNTLRIIQESHDGYGKPSSDYNGQIEFKVLRVVNK